MEVNNRNLIWVKLCVTGHALLGVWASLLYFELWPEESNFSGQTTIILIGVAALLHAVISYCVIKWFKLDVYFRASKLPFTFATLALLTLFGVIVLDLIFTRIPDPDTIELFFPGESDVPSGYYQYTVIVTAGLVLYFWYLSVSIITLFFVVSRTAYSAVRSKLPTIQKLAEDKIEKSVQFTKEQYAQSNLPLQKKLKKGKLLAELADLNEVEPEKREFTKADYRSKKKDIDEVADLERQLRIKKLEKELQDLKEDSPSS